MDSSWPPQRPRNRHLDQAAPPALLGPGVPKKARGKKSVLPQLDKNENTGTEHWKFCESESPTDFIGHSAAPVISNQVMLVH